MFKIVSKCRWDELMKGYSDLLNRVEVLERRSVINVLKYPKIQLSSYTGFDTIHKLPVDEALWKILHHLGIEFKYHAEHGPSCSIEKEATNE